MDDFLLRASVAGAAIAAVAGPFGSFVVWRRMAFFGDTLAHAALLGVGLGLLLGVDVAVATLGICAALALLLVLLGRGTGLPSDTLLGILSHGSLAFGLVLVSSLETLRVDLVSYLFGDILAVSPAEVAWICGGSAAALAALGLLWRPLLAMTVHEELARVEGVRVAAVHLAFVLLLAAVVALMMKAVGILLISALLVAPAAAARRGARSPESMAAGAAAAGLCAVGAGLWASLRWDTPAGPSIVVAAVLLFGLSRALPAGRDRAG